MQVEYHCRGCGQRQEFTVSLDDLTKIRKKEDFITLLILWVRYHIHKDCPKADIGVKIVN